MKKFFLLSLIHFFWPGLLFTPAIYAQDQRKIEQILQARQPGAVTPYPKDFQWKWEGARYLMDFNGDGAADIFQLSLVDGVYWVGLSSSPGKVVFRRPLDSQGKESSLYRLRLVKLGPRFRLLIFYFYKGQVDSTQFLAGSTFYFLVMEEGSWNHLDFQKGPDFFVEKAYQKREYFHRTYKLDFRDLNGDKRRELVMSYGSIDHIYQYHPKKGWISLTQ